MSYPKKDKFFFLEMFFAMSIWGFAWSIGKLAAQALAMGPLIFWRFTISSLSLLLFLWLSQKLIFLPRSLWLVVLGSATSTVLYNYFFFAGIRHGLSGAGGVLVTTTNPLFTFLLVALFRRQKLRKTDWLGLSLGLLGGMLMLQVWQLKQAEFFQRGNLFFLLASITWAFATFTAQRAGNFISPIVFSFYTFFLAAFLTWPLSGFDFGSQLLLAIQLNPGFLWQLLFLTVITNSFATVLYFNATKVVGSSRASSFIFLVPLSAMLSSWLIFAEKPQLTTILGGSLALIAVMLLNSQKS